MRILILGSGGREHALAHALAADPRTTYLVAAPGNSAMPVDLLAPTLDPCDGQAVTALAVAEDIDLVVVGPEAPLVAGVADALRAAGIATFGPSQAAAALEGSKAFAKEIMAAAGVPTAAAVVCTNEAELRAGLEQIAELNSSRASTQPTTQAAPADQAAPAAVGLPYVVKDDGLAAGKGVAVTPDFEQALAHGLACLNKPGGKVVLEEYLDGPEVSLFCICDGQDVVPLEPAQDFKRIGDGDTGPNTGGMGAYSPLPWVPAGLTEQVLAEVARPVVAEMQRRGTPFSGLLYCGLALTSRGMRVVEFNARFGDPETQVILPRLASSLVELLYASATGTLAQLPELQWHPQAAVTVVMAAAGYPGTPTRDDAITGLPGAAAEPGVHVIHAGTKWVAPADLSSGDDGNYFTAGGRVLCVVGSGDTVAAARARAYAGVQHISFETNPAQYRTDIAAGI